MCLGCVGQQIAFAQHHMGLMQQLAVCVNPLRLQGCLVITFQLQLARPTYIYISIVQVKPVDAQRNVTQY